MNFHEMSNIHDEVHKYLLDNACSVVLREIRVPSVLSVDHSFKLATFNALSAKILGVIGFFRIFQIFSDFLDFLDFFGF